MTQKTPDTLTAEIMACCPVKNPDTRPMYFTAEEKERFTTFVQAYFAGTPITPGVTFDGEGNNLIKVVTVLLTEDRTDPIGANFSPVVIQHWLAAQEKKGEDENEQKTVFAEITAGFTAILDSAHLRFPFADMPYVFTATELDNMRHLGEAYFANFGLNVEFETETGPDDVNGALVIKGKYIVTSANGVATETLVFPASHLKARQAVTQEFIDTLKAMADSRPNLTPPPARPVGPVVQVKVLDEELYWGKNVAPKGSDDSACIDLMAGVPESITLSPGEVKLVPTGLAFYIADPAFVGLVHPRSGLGHKHGIVLGNLTGVIDADYQGQLMVSLWNRNRSGEPFVINRGDRIAQYMVQPVVHPDFQTVTEFTQASERGAGGFGHSGVGQVVAEHRHHSDTRKEEIGLSGVDIFNESKVNKVVL